MNIGKLDTPVMIRNFSSSRDDYGGEVKSWQDWRRCFSSVSFEGGREREEEGRRTATTVVKFAFRTLDIEGVKEDFRIVFDGDDYDILEILNAGRRSLTTIKAEKKY